MLKVIYKDLVLNRNALIINWTLFGLFFVYMAAQADMRPTPFVVFSAVMSTFAPFTLLTREDKFKGMVLGCSLPVTRRTIVTARYGLTIGLAILGLAGAITLGIVLPFSHLTPGGLLAPRVILSGLTVTGIIIALMLPFTIRFGFFGLVVFMVVMQIIGIALFLMVQVTRSDGDRRLIAAVLESIRTAKAALGTPVFDVIVLTALVVGVALSYGLSVGILERREL